MTIEEAKALKRGDIVKCKSDGKWLIVSYIVCRGSRNTGRYVEVYCRECRNPFEKIKRIFDSDSASIPNVMVAPYNHTMLTRIKEGQIRCF